MAADISTPVYSPLQSDPSDHEGFPLGVVTDIMTPDLSPEFESSATAETPPLPEGVEAVAAQRNGPGLDIVAYDGREAYIHRRDLVMFERVVKSLVNSGEIHDVPELRAFVARNVVASLHEAEQRAGLEPTDTSAFEYRAPKDWV